MPRRVSLPAADDLFRPTDDKPRLAAAPEPSDDGAGVGSDQAADGRRAATKRVRHDEKMTVYISSEELLDLEEARLRLRRQGVSVDRGRLVRAAVSMALSDLDEHGESSELVRRLTEG